MGRKVVQQRIKTPEDNQLEEIFNHPGLKFITISKDKYHPDREMRDVATQTGETYDEYMKLCSILAMDHESLFLPGEEHM